MEEVDKQRVITSRAARVSAARYFLDECPQNSLHGKRRAHGKKLGYCQRKPYTMDVLNLYFRVLLEVFP